EPNMSSQAPAAATTLPGCLFGRLFQCGTIAESRSWLGRAEESHSDADLLQPMISGAGSPQGPRHLREPGRLPDRDPGSWDARRPVTRLKPPSPKRTALDGRQHRYAE